MVDDAARMDVAELQATLEQHGARWEAGATFLTELPYNERKRYLGFEPPGGLTLEEIEQKASELAGEHAAAGEAVGYPASFDWRNVRRSQLHHARSGTRAGCGSCVAFGTYSDGRRQLSRVQRGNPDLAVDLSEASAVLLHRSLAGAELCGASDGWWVPPALDGLQERSACPTRPAIPYTAGDQDCAQPVLGLGRTAPRKITAWHSDLVRTTT